MTNLKQKQRFYTVTDVSYKRRPWKGAHHDFQNSLSTEPVI